MNLTLCSYYRNIPANEFSGGTVCQSTENIGRKFIFKLRCTNFCLDFSSKFLSHCNKDREWTILSRQNTYLGDINTHNVVAALYFYKAYIYKALHMQYIYLYIKFIPKNSILHSTYIQEKYLENSQIKKLMKEVVLN